MATAEEIAAFRLLIAEPADKAPYDDISIGNRLDSTTTPATLAAQIWREKAAAYAELVTVSESGSSRSLSDLHKQAIAMATTFGSVDSAPAASVRGVVMKRLVR